LPVAVINGRRDGPTVLVSGAIHGDEINGVEICRRILKRLDPRKLSGAVIVVPVVNVLGFLANDRYLPDRRDLNRSFPGSKRGSLASRLAYLFMTEVVAPADIVIDLHSAAGARTNVPQIRADLDDEETKALAEEFGAPFVIHARVRDGSLRQAATERGKKVLLYEAGEIMRFETEAVETGLAGVLRVLTAAGVGSWEDVAPSTFPVEVRKTSWVRATRSGIADLSEVELGMKVEEGDRLGSIGDALGGRPTMFKASASGFVIAKTLNPLVSVGEALVHLAVPNAEGRDEPAVKRRRSTR
jgi:predicted deacylase